MVSKLGSIMLDEEMKVELDSFRKENVALKKGIFIGISLKFSEKGVVSVYGFGCFFVTLYK